MNAFPRLTVRHTSAHIMGQVGWPLGAGGQLQADVAGRGHCSKLRQAARARPRGMNQLCRLACPGVVCPGSASPACAFMGPPPGGPRPCALLLLVCPRILFCVLFCGPYSPLWQVMQCSWHQRSVPNRKGTQLGPNIIQASFQTLPVCARGCACCRCTSQRSTGCCS